MLAAALVLARRTGRSGCGRALWTLLLLCVFGAGWGRMWGTLCQDRKLEASLPEDGAAVSAEGRAVWLEENEKWLVVTLETADWGKVLVYLEKEDGGLQNGEEEEMIRPGRRLRAEGQVSRFDEPGNPGQFNLRRYYRSKGIAMSLFAERVTGEEGGGYWPYLDGLYRIRRHFCRILESVCEPGDLGIFQAAILGEKGEMDAQIQDLYQKSGIAHLLAISGLHLSLVGMGFYRLLRRFGLGFGPAGAAGCAAVISYGIMTGSSGSAMRAVIMLSVSFLAAYLGRTYDLLSSLSLAAILLAASRPLMILESGFQLSFGAVLGIGMTGECLKEALRPGRGLPESLLTSVGIQLVTVPIVLWHYYQYPVYGILLNLLVIPLMGCVIISGMLAMSVGVVSLSLGRAAIGSGHYILLLYQWLCRLFLRLPGSQMIMGRPGAPQLFCYVAAAALLVFGIRYGGEIKGRFTKKRTDRGEEEKENAAITRIKWGIFLLGSIGCFLLLLPPGQKGLTVCFMDVGQGDGTVIRTEPGKICFTGLSGTGEGGQAGARGTFAVSPISGRGITVLVDSGSTSDKSEGENRLVPYLKYCGIRAVDVIMVSHGDEDHINGLTYLLQECPEIAAGCLVLPEAGRGDAAYDGLLLAAAARGLTVWYMDAGDQIRAGGLLLTCLYPGEGEELRNPDRNRQSLVVKGDYPGLCFLLTGDTSQECEARILKRTDPEILGEVQVLQAAHHGSRYSSSQAFLDAVSPAVTVISYGEANRYGHPHAETIGRIQKTGSLILETGSQGAVTINVRDGRAVCRVYQREEQ